MVCDRCEVCGAEANVEGLCIFIVGEDPRPEMVCRCLCPSCGQRLSERNHTALWPEKAWALHLH